MYRRNWWDLRAQANDGTGGNEGGGGPDAAAAREFLTPWAPDPEIVKTLPDDQVLAWHGNVTKNLTAAQAKALEGYDWRAPILKAKPDAAKTLERMPGPVELYDSFDNLRTKLSKGELRSVQPFPEKGSDEEKAAWRTQNGVPDAPEKYEFKPAEGIVIGEEDKPRLQSFAKYAFEHNLPASYVNEAANWFFSERVTQQQAAHEQFETQKRETAAALGAEWGPEYKANLNKIQGIVDAKIPAGEKGEGDQLKSLISNAVATNPMFARFMAGLALDINPVGTLVPGDRGANEGSVKDELLKIEGERKKNRGYKDDDQRKRYIDLIGHYQRLTGKEWGRE